MVFKDINDIDLTHIFECGQCFRWVPDGPDTYTGAAGAFAARISLADGCLDAEATGGDDYIGTIWGRGYLLQAPEDKK